MNPAGPTIARPGSIENRGSGVPRLGGRRRDRRGHVLRDPVRVQRHVARQVRDAVAAAQVDLVDQHAGPLGERSAQPEHDARGDLEPRRVEDLRADVRVDAQQVQLGVGQHREQRGHRGRVTVPARRDRQPELLVLVRGRDVLVPAGVHARGHAHHHRCGRSPALLDQRREALDLDERVDDDPAHAVLERSRELVVGLVVAVQADVRTRDARAQRDRELAARRGVHAQTLVVHPPRDRDRQERLARVVHVDPGAHLGERGRERTPVARGTRAQVRLVEHVRGRSVLVGERATATPATTSAPEPSRATPVDQGSPGMLVVTSAPAR